MKKLILIIIFIGISIGPAFADITLYLPKDHKEDLSINTKGNKSNNSTIKGNEKTLYNGINLINSYLWRSFGIIAMILSIYGGYEAFTSNGDSKVYKKVMRIFIGTAIGLLIAIISSAAVKILANII